MSLSSFKVLQFLGKGSYGSVYKVIRKSDGKEYAMKEVKIKYMTQQEREEAVNEVRMLASVSHPGVISYCESFYEADKLYIITDFAEQGDLNAEIKKLKNLFKRFDEDTIWSYFIQMCIALNDLHDKNILHRDLKCGNIFLTKGNIIKIGDLGVAKLLKAGMTKTQVGTPYYISPEIWKKLPYDSKSDVWSLGCVLYELSTFKHPFTADSPKALAGKIMGGRYSDISPSYSQDLSEMIRKMLCVEARKRPSMEDIMEMPAVQKRMGLLPQQIRDFYTLETAKRRPSRVISTIKVPRNLGKLAENLPSPCYPGAKRLFSSPKASPRKSIQNDITVSTKSEYAPRPISLVVPSPVKEVPKVNQPRLVKPAPIRSGAILPRPSLYAPAQYERPVAPQRLSRPVAEPVIPVKANPKDRIIKGIVAPPQNIVRNYAVAREKENIPAKPEKMSHADIEAEIQRIRSRRLALQEIANRRISALNNAAIVRPPAVPVAALPSADARQRMRRY